jgi:raffinose/stachyose/melibiose transport system substrate-binding protein
MLPIYIGVSGEEQQGLCTGTENFWVVNKNAKPEDIQATLNFMYWCVTSDEGLDALCKDMGFVIPFKKNLPAANPLVNIANDYVAKGFVPVAWTFPTMPSEQWKNGVGSALTMYAAGTKGWDTVVAAFVDGWAEEYAAANNE